MQHEVESWPGELKTLREFLDGYIESFETKVTIETVKELCQEEFVIQLFQDYLKRKAIKENYERLNKGLNNDN